MMFQARQISAVGLRRTQAFEPKEKITLVALQNASGN